MYLGQKVGLFRPSVECAVRVVGELARAEGECILQSEDEYCKQTSSKGPLNPSSTPFFGDSCIDFRVFVPKKHG